MCYYVTKKVNPTNYFQHLESGNRYAFLNEELIIHKGFDHNTCEIERNTAGAKSRETVNMQWGFLPPYLKSYDDVKKFRYGYKDESGRFHKGFTTLNATSEELLTKIYKEAALKRRCLLPVNGFYEWMHVMVVGKSGKLLKTPEKFPYLVQLRQQEEFYLAAIWQAWFNAEVKMVINTFSIVTTSANTLMKQIHNSKERMPTILTGDLANTWMHEELNEEEILDVANYQIASEEMIATPLHKDFLKREKPNEPFVYKEAPELVYH